MKKLFALFLLVTSTGICHGEVKGKSLWGAKDRTLSEVVRKAHFPIVLPHSHDDSIRISKAHLVWMRKFDEVVSTATTLGGTDFKPVKHDLPARQAACFFLKIKGKPDVVIVQVRALPGYPTRSGYFPNENLYQIVGQGYFFVQLANGIAMHTGRFGDTDYLMLTRDRELAKDLGRRMRAHARPQPVGSSPGFQPRAAGVRPQPSLYSVVVPPNVRQSESVIGLVMTDPSSSATQQIAIVRSVANRVFNYTKKKRISVYLFATLPEAKRFRIFQRARSGQPLAAREFIQLREMWKSVPVMLRKRGRTEEIRYPAKSPGDWWRK